MGAFRLNEWILLCSQKGKKWLVKVENAPFSTHAGTVQMQDAIGREEGAHLVTNQGAKLFLFRPTLEEYIYKLKRQTQIIYPKDLGAIVFYGDIQPGHTVLETGVGSGALSLALLRAVGEKGKLISVEKRIEFARLATENITKYFIQNPENHTIVVADIQEVSLKIEADRAILDLPEPWCAIASVSRMLQPGGILVSLSPNVGQVQLTHRELKSFGYANISTFELLKRDWKIDERRARPADRMIAHTGFLTIAKKITRLPVDPENNPF
jgi:tRNA (adenine57-N1/adenine58-N1)-methyltransferase